MASGAGLDLPAVSHVPQEPFVVQRQGAQAVQLVNGVAMVPLHVRIVQLASSAMLDRHYVEHAQKDITVMLEQLVASNAHLGRFQIQTRLNASIVLLALLASQLLQGVLLAALVVGAQSNLRNVPFVPLADIHRVLRNHAEHVLLELGVCLLQAHA